MNETAIIPAAGVTHNYREAGTFTIEAHDQKTGRIGFAAVTVPLPELVLTATLDEATGAVTLAVDKQHAGDTFTIDWDAEGATP